jgi:hypothetical protein
LSSVYDCDINGSFVSLAVEYQTDSPLCVNEISVYSTVNIAPSAEVSFSGESGYDPRLVVEAPVISTCDD